MLNKNGSTASERNPDPMKRPAASRTRWWVAGPLRRHAKMVFVTAALSPAGCEYGDTHGTAGNADMILGLKEKPVEIYSFRDGVRDFTGYFVSDFPATSAPYLTAPPESFFDHPRPQSYESGHTLVKWRRNPVAPAQRFLLDRALSVMRGHGLPADQIKEFEKQSKSNDGYHAALFKNVGSGMYDDITFYLLDPRARRLRCLTDTSSFQTQSSSSDR